MLQSLVHCYVAPCRCVSSVGSGAGGSDAACGAGAATPGSAHGTHHDQDGPGRPGGDAEHQGHALQQPGAAPAAPRGVGRWCPQKHGQPLVVLHACALQFSMADAHFRQRKMNMFVLLPGCRAARRCSAWLLCLLCSLCSDCSCTRWHSMLQQTP